MAVDVATIVDEELYNICLARIKIYALAELSFTDFLSLTSEQAAQAVFVDVLELVTNTKLCFANATEAKLNAAAKLALDLPLHHVTVQTGSAVLTLVAALDENHRYPVIKAEAMLATRCLVANADAGQLAAQLRSLGFEAAELGLWDSKATPHFDSHGDLAVVSLALHALWHDQQLDTPVAMQDYCIRLPFELASVYIRRRDTCLRLSRGLAVLPLNQFVPILRAAFIRAIRARVKGLSRASAQLFFGMTAEEGNGSV